MIVVLVVAALFGCGLWLIVRKRSHGSLELGLTLCTLALAAAMLGIVVTMQHNSETRCRAVGGVPVSTGRTGAINCSNQHGGFIDPEDWR